MKEHGTLVGRDCPESRCHLSSQAWIPSFASCRANSSTAGLSIVLLRKKDVERHLQFCSKRAAQIARASGCVFLAEPDPLFITSFKRDNEFYHVREGGLFLDTFDRRGKRDIKRSDSDVAQRILCALMVIKAIAAKYAGDGRS